MAPSSNKKSLRRSRMSRQLNLITSSRVPSHKRPSRVEHDVIEGIDFFSFTDELELDYFTDLEEPLPRKIKDFHGFEEDDVSANLVKTCFDSFVRNFKSTGHIYGASYNLPSSPKAEPLEAPETIPFIHDEKPVNKTVKRSIVTVDNPLSTTDELDYQTANAQKVFAEGTVDNKAAAEVITIDDSDDDDDDDDVVIVGDPLAPLPKPVRDCVCPNCGKFKRKEPPPKAGTLEQEMTPPLINSPEKDEVMIIADEDVPYKREHIRNVSPQENVSVPSEVLVHPDQAPAQRTGSDHHGNKFGSNGSSTSTDEVLVIDDDDQPEKASASPTNRSEFIRWLELTKKKRKAAMAQPDELPPPKVQTPASSGGASQSKSQRAPVPPELMSQIKTTSPGGKSTPKSQPKLSSQPARLSFDSVLKSFSSSSHPDCSLKVSARPVTLPDHQTRKSIATTCSVESSPPISIQSVDRSVVHMRLVSTPSEPHRKYLTIPSLNGEPLRLKPTKPLPGAPSESQESPLEPSLAHVDKPGSSKNVKLFGAVPSDFISIKSQRTDSSSHQVTPLPCPPLNTLQKPAMKNKSTVPGTVRLILPDSGKTVILKLDGSKSKMLPPSVKTDLIRGCHVVSPKNRVTVANLDKPLEPQIASEAIITKRLLVPGSKLSQHGQLPTSAVGIIRKSSVSTGMIPQRVVVDPEVNSVVQDLVDFVCRNELFPKSYKYDEERSESVCLAVSCREERCRLGCICISLAKKTVRRVRCKNPSCIFGCSCLSHGKPHLANRHVIIKSDKKVMGMRQGEGMVSSGAERSMSFGPRAGAHVALKTFLPIRKVIGVSSSHLDTTPTYRILHPQPAKALIRFVSSPKTDDQSLCPGSGNGLSSAQPRRFFGREKVPIPERALACLTPGVGYVPLFETNPRVSLLNPFTPGAISFLHVREATEWLNSKLRPILLSGSELRWVVVDKSTIEKKALHRLCLDSLKLLPTGSCDTKNVA